MYLEITALASVLLAFSTRATSAAFNPGCSFSDGQCQYNVQLGHSGQCDSPPQQAISTDAADQSQCCLQLQSQVTSLTNDVSTLKTQVATLMSELTSAQQNQTDTRQQLTGAEARTQQLLQTLAEKEAELNNSNSHLAEVIRQAGQEIGNLRTRVTSLSSELRTCKGTLGLVTDTTKLSSSSILPSDVKVLHCDFEQHSGDDDVFCGYRNSSNTYTFRRGSGRQASTTGPIEDHTLGSPHGHYMFLDADRIGHDSHISTSKVSIASPVLPPADGYCVRLWYNMYGSDVVELDVYANVGTGNGYPVFHKTGDGGQMWHLAEVDLDREYTSHDFHVEISATTNARRTYSSIYYTKGDIAIDDIYVYNTSCKNLPLCPPGGVTRVEGSQTACYTFHVQPATWYEAAALCREETASSALVSIANLAEQNFIVGTIKNSTELSAAGQYGYFTAGNNERQPGPNSYDWTDTGTPYRITYTNWKQGQPNNVGDDQYCMLLEYPDLNYQWGDVDCDERHPFICKATYPTPPVANTASSPLLG